ncbi:MAG: SDR family NAD(P)-dependent oxidoreductase [Anaerolineae bacterium]|nr:SDR family NAD(P)-dependent oxidoreductase [Anaerolineae bacterium]
MSSAFAGKRCIITGAASGIGQASARLLKAQGARLALWDRDADGVQRLAAELGAEAYVVDVTDADAVAAAVEQSALGGLDALLHCAGILHTRTFEQIPINDQRRMVEVNFIGTMTIAHAALPHLRSSRGSLVLVASLSAFYGAPEYAVYGATKAAVLSFAQALRVELAGSGVHIGVVCPLFVNTPMIAGYNGNTHLIRSRSPLFNTSEPGQIAAVILRGIERRAFMIFPGWRTRLVFWITRYAHFLNHRVTLMTYRQGGG